MSCGLPWGGEERDAPRGVACAALGCFMGVAREHNRGMGGKVALAWAVER